MKPYTAIPTPSEVSEARRLKQSEEELSEKLRVAVKTAMEAGEDKCVVDYYDGLGLTAVQRATNRVIAEMRAAGWATSHVLRGAGIYIDWCPHPEKGDPVPEEP